MGVAISVVLCGGAALCVYCCICRKKRPKPFYLDQVERGSELGSESEEGEEEEEEEQLPYGAACPPYWQNKDLQSAFDDRYEVPKFVKETIQKMLDETWKDIQTRDRKGPAPVRLEVVNGQRIEDRNMWANYLIQKAKIRETRGQCQPLQAISSGDCLTSVSGGQLFGGALETGLNEFYLWHGTSPQGAHGISEDGFQIALSGTHAGAMFGRGAYFAECSSKADEYSYEGNGIYAGIYAMLLCRVCCGEMKRVFRSDVPAIERALESGVCDSILGDRAASVGTYREFVVFRERQIYPEYVVLYRRVNEESDEFSPTD